jgi:hypothetical protein
MTPSFSEWLRANEGFAGIAKALATQRTTPQFRSPVVQQAHREIMRAVSAVVGQPAAAKPDAEPQQHKEPPAPPANQYYRRMGVSWREQAELMEDAGPTLASVEQAIAAALRKVDDALTVKKPVVQKPAPAGGQDDRLRQYHWQHVDQYGDSVKGEPVLK